MKPNLEIKLDMNEITSTGDAVLGGIQLTRQVLLYNCKYPS
jgi:hypothetical protein